MKVSKRDYYFGGGFVFAAGLSWNIDKKRLRRRGRSAVEKKGARGCRRPDVDNKDVSTTGVTLSRSRSDEPRQAV
jgi:hypothetical protein